MRNFTRTLFSFLAVSVLTISVKAQCPTNIGMTASPISYLGNCFVLVQFAHPNGNVSIYNASGLIGNKQANAQGVATIPYPCGSNPITAVLSISPTGEVCNNVSIAQPSILPVKYNYFRSAVVANGVDLQWATSYEFNNAKFVIEKSTDGRNYSEIGTVAGSENSSTEKAYSFLDASFKKGEAAYYRIKQVDFDSRSEYSKIVFVDTRNSGTDKVKIFPNPISGNEAIQISGINSADINKGNIRVFNISGNAVGFKLAGSNAIQLDENAPIGVYIIRINEHSFRVVKK